MNNIQQVSDAYMCSNCGACSAACPKDAISFKSSTMGRLYACVTDNCINCGICKKVCPSLDQLGLHANNIDKCHGQIISVRVGKSCNESYFKNGQSGGIIATILHYLFKTEKINAAVVCKMEYGETPIVKGHLITSVNDLLLIQKSCYTPVVLLSALRVSSKADRIAIVGLPCHIEGATLLANGKYYDIKYKIGLICDRTLCAGIATTLKSYSSIKGEIKIDWRRKDFVKNDEYYPYKSAPVVVYTEDDQEIVLNNKYRFALKDFFTAPRCRVCYDKMNTFADIVCGDPWGMSNVDWNKGESLIITRTILGESVVKEMMQNGMADLRDGDYNEVILGQHLDRKMGELSCYSRAARILPNRIPSFLYEQDNIAPSPLKLKKAETEFQDFIVHESMTESQIVDTAKSVVAIYERKCKKDVSFLYRLIRKIKNIAR